ncbi:MAG: hypothetical protein ACREMY_06230, partial [bacterium]
MTQVDLAEILGMMEKVGWPLHAVEVDSPEFTQIPEQWRPIVLSSGPDAHRRAALALWNREFLGLMPNFTELFRTQLVDVRVYDSVAAPILLYLSKGVGKE